MPRTTKRIVTLFLMGILLVLASCGGGGPLPTDIPASDANSTTQPSNSQESEAPSLRMALLPVLDVLPFHVAEQNGYFDQVGVQVELVPVKSAQERDTLMQTGQVDGMLTDLLSPVLFNQDEAQIKAVRTARRAYADAPVFRLLAAPGSSVTSPAELAGVPVGSAQNTVIEYLTYRMLQKAGLADSEITTQEVSAIPVRFELLVNG